MRDPAMRMKENAEHETESDTEWGETAGRTDQLQFSRQASS